MSRWAKPTKLVSVGTGTAYAHSEVTFERVDEDGREYTIHACKVYESWEQWGAPAEVLGDNVEAVEAWRSGKLKKGWPEKSKRWQEGCGEES